MSRRAVFTLAVVFGLGAHIGSDPRAHATQVAAAPAVSVMSRYRRHSHPVLHHVSQRAGEYRRLVARRTRPRASSRPGRDLGKGAGQAADRCDAAGGDAAAGSAPPTPVDRLAGNDARPGGRAGSESGPAAAPSPEPRRIRQRDPRPAGARRRRRDAAAAGRFELRLRQHRRRARRVAGAAGALSVGGGQDQRARGRRPGDGGGRGNDLPGAGRPHAGRAHRRSAARHARRHPDPHTRSRSTAST